MTTRSHAETPFLQLLLLWAAHHVARIAESIRPQHLAGEISADVAASGHPSGA